jgi:PAS domain S-box-containing protein/diguanylate cyclase (GGDEF)-like protein
MREIDRLRVLTIHVRFFSTGFRMTCWIASREFGVVVGIAMHDGMMFETETPLASRRPAIDEAGQAILERSGSFLGTPRIIAANARFARLFCRRPEDIIGSTLSESAGPMIDPAQRLHLNQVLESRAPVSVTLQLPSGDAVLNIRPLMDANGISSHIVVTEEVEPNDRQISRIIDHLLTAVFVVDVLPDGRFRYVMLNRRYQDLTGLKAADLIGHGPDEFLSPDDAATVLAHYRTCVRRCQPTTFQEVLSLPTGRRHWETRLVPLTGGGGNTDVIRIFGSSIDISERVTAEQALRDSEQRFRSIFEHAGVGIGYAAINGQIIDVNRTLEQMLGYGRDELIGSLFRHFVHPEELAQMNGRFQELLNGRRALYQAERRFLRKDGSIMWARTTTSLVRDPLGRPKYLVGLFEDVTEAHQARERIDFLASFDQVTGLPNLSLFEERVAAAVDRPGPDRQVAAMLAIGFDRIDSIRFTLCRQAADELMRGLVDRLRRALGPTDIIGRIGDALFAVLLPGLSEAEEAIAAVKGIIATFSTPLEADSQDFLVMPTIGVSLFPTDGETPDVLIRTAGAALQRARDQGCTRFELYEPDMETSAVRQLSMESRLRRAIDRDQFELVYQPKIEVESQSLVGFEALVRWRDDSGTLINPGEFIPVAEDTGLIVPLGELVLRRACEQMAEWRASGVVDVPVSVNLSGRQVSDPLLGRKILATLERCGLPATSLKLELTETALFRSSAALRDTLLELHAAGVRFLLDDFGTGYSSLSYLKRFPIEAIKIDKSFVQSMVQDQDAASIVNAIIHMAHALKMQVVAEGVETREQLLFLRAYRCDRMQGFLFSRPIPAEAIPALMAQMAERR